MSRYKINNLEEYFKNIKSVREPRKFWDKIASENSPGTRVEEKVVDFNMAGSQYKNGFVDASKILLEIVLTDTLPKGDKEP
jgi:acetyl-CoA synthetase